MTKRNRLLMVTLTGAFAVTMLLSSAAGAAECRTKPDEAEGGRWFFRTNQETKRKCWYRQTKDVETTGAPTSLRKPQVPAQTTAPVKSSVRADPPTRTDTPVPVDTTTMTAAQLKDLYDQFLQWRAKREMR
jgi:hypothetical protein